MMITEIDPILRTIS